MEENLKLEELIEHRDFLLQLVEDQNKRIRSARLKRSLKKMADDPAITEFLDKQNLRDNVTRQKELMFPNDKTWGKEGKA